jgi:hypothetical protein
MSRVSVRIDPAAALGADAKYSSIVPGWAQLNQMGLETQKSITIEKTRKAPGKDGGAGRNRTDA